jgi:hypothetical protein
VAGNRIGAVAQVAKTTRQGSLDASILAKDERRLTQIIFRGIDKPAGGGDPQK